VYNVAMQHKILQKKIPNRGELGIFYESFLRDEKLLRERQIPEIVAICYFALLAVRNISHLIF
jgi:hypothetical protein